MFLFINITIIIGTGQIWLSVTITIYLLVLNDFIFETSDEASLKQLNLNSYFSIWLLINWLNLLIYVKTFVKIFFSYFI